MALTDLFRRNARPADGGRLHEANSLLRTTGAGLYYERKRYSDVYLWIVINRIYSGLRSVVFANTDSQPDKEVDDLCKYVMSNAEALVWQYYERGYMVLDVTSTARPAIVLDARVEEGGHVHQPKGRRYAVVYSPEYATQRLSAFKILRNEFDAIDTLRSADRYLTESLGAVGLISGKEMPMTAGEKESFLKEVKEKVGITPDKFQFLIATGSISYTPIAIPVADLNLMGRVEGTLKLICDYLNVPYDLISFSGQSTYANQEQAVKLFYTNCIAPLAEQLLLLIRHAIRLDTQLLVLSDNVTFTIDNTTISSEEQSARLATLMAELQLIQEAAAAGVDTTEAAAKLQQKINEL